MSDLVPIWWISKTTPPIFIFPPRQGQDLVLSYPLLLIYALSILVSNLFRTHFLFRSGLWAMSQCSLQLEQSGPLRTCGDNQSGQLVRQQRGRNNHRKWFYCNYHNSSLTSSGLCLTVRETIMSLVIQGSHLGAISVRSLSLKFPHLHIQPSIMITDPIVSLK